jgi:DNA-binding GntR family transcriptional regulator
MDRESSAATDKRPASRRIADELRQAIADGHYAAKPLPSYRQLMTTYGVALNTAQAAVRQLESEGLVTIRQGKSPVVRERDSEPVSAEAQLAQLRAELLDVRDAMREAGATVVSLERRLTDLVSRIPSVTN